VYGHLDSSWQVVVSAVVVGAFFGLLTSLLQQLSTAQASATGLAAGIIHATFGVRRLRQRQRDRQQAAQPRQAQALPPSFSADKDGRLHWTDVATATEANAKSNGG
jgi:hypothetical protein